MQSGQFVDPEFVGRQLRLFTDMVARLNVAYQDAIQKKS